MLTKHLAGKNGSLAEADGNSWVQPVALFLVKKRGTIETYLEAFTLRETPGEITLRESVP